MNDPAQMDTGAGKAPIAVIPRDEIEMLDVINILLRRWKLVVGLPLVLGLATAVVVLIIPEKYTATASFVPQTADRATAVPGNLASLASQFGVSVPGGGEASPQFYADALRSRTVKDQLLSSSFSDPEAPESGEQRPLRVLLEIEGENEREIFEEGRELLSDITSVEVNSQTGVVSITVETKYPELSADMANRYLDVLNAFALRMRTERAAERRAFLEGRLADVEGTLREAEEEMRGFLESNRDFSTSPQLAFEHQRIQRQLRILEEVFTTLRRENEQIRIQELNTTETLATIDRAVPPFEKSSPRRTVAVLAAILVGGLLATAIAFVGSYVERAKVRNRAQASAFASNWHQLKREIRTLLPRLGQ